MLLDSNIIIYAAQPEHADLRGFIAQQDLAVSAISVVEVLGFHRLSQDERTHFEEFFRASRILAVSDLVIGEAVRLRQQRKMTLGDALIGTQRRLVKDDPYVNLGAAELGDRPERARRFSNAT